MPRRAFGEGGSILTRNTGERIVPLPAFLTPGQLAGACDGDGHTLAEPRTPVRGKTDQFNDGNARNLQDLLWATDETKEFLFNH